MRYRFREIAIDEATRRELEDSSRPPSRRSPLDRCASAIESTSRRRRSRLTVPARQGLDANIYMRLMNYTLNRHGRSCTARVLFRAMIKTNEFARSAGLVALLPALFSRAASIIFLRYNRTIGDDEQVSGQDESSFIRITKIKFAPCL